MKESMEILLAGVRPRHCLRRPVRDWVSNMQALYVGYCTFTDDCSRESQIIDYARRVGQGQEGSFGFMLVIP